MTSGRISKVSAGENAQSKNVHVLLGRCLDDHPGALADASIDDLHAGVAEGAGDYLGAPIVSVESGLGYKDPECGLSLFCISIYSTLVFLSLAGHPGCGQPLGNRTATKAPMTPAPTPMVA